MAVSCPRCGVILNWGCEALNLLLDGAICSPTGLGINQLVGLGLCSLQIKTTRGNVLFSCLLSASVLSYSKTLKRKPGLGEAWGRWRGGFTAVSPSRSAALAPGSTSRRLQVWSCLCFVPLSICTALPEPELKREERKEEGLLWGFVELIWL